MIALDASVLVAHLDKRDEHYLRAVRLLLEHSELEFVASPVTLAEVLVGPARADRINDARALLDALAVREIALGPDAAMRLAILRAETSLKLPDCCVLLAAGDARAQAVATFDDRLAKAAGQMGLRVV